MKLHRCTNLRSHSPFGLALSLLLAAQSGCSNDTDSRNDSADHPGDHNGQDNLSLDPGVSLGGAQDFGQFREILELGQIPAPSTLDETGFFNEHKIPLPPATCGQPVCMHALMGTMSNMINGNNCTMAFVAFNTAIDPETAVRPPLHLALAVDTSGSMNGPRLDYLKLGLRQLAAGLTAQDRVTLIPFDAQAHVVASASAPDAPELAAAITALAAAGTTNIYDGLRRAYEAADSPDLVGYQPRVLLLTDGQSNTGVQDAARMTRLSHSYAAKGISTTTIGLGEEYDPTLVRTIAQEGGGAFYFVRNPADVAEIFAQEAEAFLIPLANDGVLTLNASAGYELRGAYGAPDIFADLSQATLEFPRMQLAHRQSVHPDAGGRRGGGGALIFELLPTAFATQSLGSLNFSYVDPASQQLQMQTAELTLPLIPAQQGEGSFFSDAGAEKAFVMLNLYAGLKMATQSAAQGQLQEALAVLDALSTSVTTWQATHLDGDIGDDLRYVDMFRQILTTQLADLPTHTQIPADPWPQD